MSRCSGSQTIWGLGSGTEREVHLELLNYLCITPMVVWTMTNLAKAKEPVTVLLKPDGFPKHRAIAVSQISVDRVRLCENRRC